MDAAYLKENVNDALMEALTAVAVADPADKVDYIGRYLLQYVERKTKDKAQKSSYLLYEQKERELKFEDDRKSIENSKLLEEKAAIDAKLPAFIESLISCNPEVIVSKQDAMDKSCVFLQEYLGLPAVYMAVKKTAKDKEGNDKEILVYTAASNGQDHVRGKILERPPESEEEGASNGKGCSFDVFKVPELPPEEEVAEGEEAPPPRPTPVPVPLKIDNVMRDKRIKFFGIPLLGAYVAVPFQTSTIDHQDGVQPRPASEASGEPPAAVEGDAPVDPALAAPVDPATLSPYIMNKIPSAFFIAADTIGKYRAIKDSEINTIKQVGDALAVCMNILEEKLFKDQVDFLTSHSRVNLAETLSGIEERVAGAKQDVADKLKQPEPAEGEAPPEPLPEQLKPYEEAVAELRVWTNALVTDTCKYALTSVQKHVLVAPKAVLTVYYVAGLIVGFDPAVGLLGTELSWDNIRSNIIPDLIEKLQEYDVSSVKAVSKTTNSLTAIKALCDANTLFEPVYPAHLPGLAPLSTWIKKAIEAREAAILYHKEVKQIDLETM